MSDSFKGSISSEESAKILSNVIKKNFPNCDTISITTADGGEGSIDAMLSAFPKNDGDLPKKIYGEFSDPLFHKIRCAFGAFRDFALIETASAASLTLMHGKGDVLNATTFGMGEQIKAALDMGYRKIILALGGSATNDAGCGMAAALGVKFRNYCGNLFIPTGKDLIEITEIDLSEIDPRIAETEFIAMCDIANPLYGKNGAAYIFGPQKGAKEKDLPLLDDGLRNFEKQSGKSLNEISGAGAAGGLGAGVSFFLNASLMSGIEVILDAINFEKLAENADLIITGEGSFDSQSLFGKVPVGISRRAKKLGIPVIVLCGSRGNNIKNSYEEGITAVFDITPSPMTLDDALLQTKENLYFTADTIMRLIKHIGGNL